VVSGKKGFKARAKNWKYTLKRYLLVLPWRSWGLGVRKKPQPRLAFFARKDPENPKVGEVLVLPWRSWGLGVKKETQACRAIFASKAPKNLKFAIKQLDYV
jgi:hypothetical protein